jgi:transcriptional regulator with XRE-family HTH domain
VPKDSVREAASGHVIRLLREARQERGVSMNDLAQRSGLSQSMISLIERDLRNPTLDTLLRVSEALGVDLGMIISKAIKAARTDARVIPPQ